jgi:hypothetical protein
MISVSCSDKPRFRMKVRKSRIVAEVRRTFCAFEKSSLSANSLAVSGLIVRSPVPTRRFVS